MSNNRGQSTFTVILLIVVAILVLGTPLVLHFGQKRHDVLDFDVATRFPDNQPIVSGEVYATAITAIMEHELNGATGWRPNDFFLWGPVLGADNNSNRQLGILQAVRESVRVFKDHLTKVSSDVFDPNLVQADTAFRNDAFKLWLPSSESKYREALRYLQLYIEGLKTTPQKSRPINQRNIELIRLFQAWGDMLGDAHARLYRDSDGFFQTDDDFYFSQGVAHAIHYMVPAVGREYSEQFNNRPIIMQLFGEVTQPLGQAATMKPLIIFDGRPEGIFANHRRNLDAYITEARQKMYSIREELEK